MELQDLLAALRATLDDDSGVALYSDADLTRFLNNAVREACLRTRGIKDDAESNPALCEIALVAGTARYAHDATILVVRSAIVEGASQRLYPLTARAMDQRCPGWDNGDAPTGTPEFLITDLEAKSLRLYPTPDASGVLRLRVWRAPSEDEAMETEGDEPVLALPDQENLIHWAAHEAYLKKDGEKYDPERAAAHETLFTQRFGPRPSAHDMARWADSPPSVRRAQTF
jgi:hypothetical protein